MSTYRMSLPAFQKLPHVLGNDIVIDEAHCPVLEHIPPQIVVAVGIRYLIPGTSIMRDMLLHNVTQQGMRRPPGNLVRCRYELHEVGLM